MAQWIKALATKPDEPKFDPLVPHWMERTDFHRLSSVFYSKAVACTTSVNK